MSTLEERVARLEAWARSFGGGGGAKAGSTASRPAATGSVASDKELDSQHGDPVVRKDPPRWDGESYEGQKYSQTEPDFLDCLAGFLDWKADKNEEEADPTRKKFIAFDRRDAFRARGWAARLRAKGTTARAPSAAGAPAPKPGADAFGGTSGEGDDEIPF